MCSARDRARGVRRRDGRAGCRARLRVPQRDRRRSSPPAHTPRWAFRPWISKDISDDADTRAFVQGFADRDIPVGAVVIDSPWETHYNTLVPNPTRYPAFDQLIADLHAQGIKIVLWTTQMMNTSAFDLEPGGDHYVGEAPPYEEGKACGFYVDDGADYLWWKGTGSGIDFSNPEAMGWWHRLQDPLLDAGLDGWKLDFGEQYLQGPPFDTAAGEQSLQDYSEAYYADYRAYGIARRGDQFITMTRGWDESYGFPGRFYARPQDATVAWMGDNRRDWIGLADALDEMFRSADGGYVVVGSDVGGYLDKDDVTLGAEIPFDTMVFARWTAVGALSPFMQLHGRANITPWTVPDHVDETVALYRYWATLHDELGPFWYSLAEEGAILHPVGGAGDFRWMLGDALLVAPILDASDGRSVDLPEGTWYDWWDGTAITGPTTIAITAEARDRIPLYVKEGAIIPMEIGNDVTGLGNASSSGALTVLVWPMFPGGTTMILHEEGETSNDAITVSGSSGGAALIELAVTGRPVIVRAFAPVAPTQVNGGLGPIPEVADRDRVLAATGDAWWYDAAGGFLWVRVADGNGTSISW